MTTGVDMLPFQALEIAAQSPQDLARFLDSLDDDTLALVGEVARRVHIMVGRARLHRRFAAMWQRVGQAHDAMPQWPDATVDSDVDSWADIEQAPVVDENAGDIPAGIPVEPSTEESTQVVPAAVVQRADTAPAVEQDTGSDAQAVS